MLQKYYINCIIGISDMGNFQTIRYLSIFAKMIVIIDFLNIKPHPFHS